jgi:hypothetical protein
LLAGACCGFYGPSKISTNAHKADANGLPLLDDSWINKPWVDSAQFCRLAPDQGLTGYRRPSSLFGWGLHARTNWMEPVNDGFFGPRMLYTFIKDGFTDVGSAF